MWRRAAAFLIDLVPLSVVFALENVLGIANSEPVGFFNGAVVLGYFAGMNYFYGGTVGKRLMGLRVALPQAPGVFWLLLVRALIKILFLFPPLLWIYALVAIWREDGRSPADLVAGSTVVDADTLYAPQPMNPMERVGATLLVLFAPCLLGFALIVLLFGIGILREVL